MYIPRDADAIATEIKSDFLIGLGIDPNTFDWTPESAITNFILAVSRRLEALEEAIASRYNLDPNTRTGREIYGLCELLGYIPFRGASSTCLVRLTNLKTYPVTIGTDIRFRAGSGLTTTYWRLVNPVTIAGSGTAEVYVASEVKGAFNLLVGELTFVLNSTLISITNIAISNLGQEPDTEEQIKEKIKYHQINGISVSTDYLSRLLKSAMEVPFVKVIANKGLTNLTIGGHTVAPKDMIIVVHPPALSEQQRQTGAEIVFSSMLPGQNVTLPANSSEGALMSNFGNDMGKVDIGFFWTTKVTLYIKVTVTSFDKKTEYASYTLPDIKNSVIAAVQQYIIKLNAESITGNDIVMQRIAAACVMVQGCRKCTVERSTNGVSWSTADLTVDDLSFIELTDVIVV